MTAATRPPTANDQPYPNQPLNPDLIFEITGDWIEQWQRCERIVKHGVAYIQLQGHNYRYVLDAKHHLVRQMILQTLHSNFQLSILNCQLSIGALGLAILAKQQRVWA
jgi:hypothetical protein